MNTLCLRPPYQKPRSNRALEAIGAQHISWCYDIGNVDRPDNPCGKVYTRRNQNNDNDKQ